MSLYGVQGASTKTDGQVINKESSEDVPGYKRGKLVNLHGQDTTNWDTFLWVEFVRECGPNFDSESAVPEIFWHQNRQSAPEANLVKVSDDPILPGCLIGLFQIKEKTNCLLPLCKGIPEISFKTHKVVDNVTMFPGATLASV